MVLFRGLARQRGSCYSRSILLMRSRVPFCLKRQYAFYFLQHSSFYEEIWWIALHLKRKRIRKAHLLFSEGRCHCSGAQAARAKIRSGWHRNVTSQLVPGIVQANLAILLAKFADDYLRFCQLNLKPCPLLGITEPINPALPMLGENITLCTDLPAYRVFKDGIKTAEVTEIEE